MSFMLESIVSVPSDANGRPFELIRAIKVIDGNTPIILETNVNNFLEGIRTTYSYVTVFEIFAVTTVGSTSRIFLSYGFFQPVV